MNPSRPPRDIYDRRTTSKSRGRTQQRIMDLQHARGELPGSDGALVDAPDGSIAACIVDFIAGWVDTLPITSRRAYERSLVLLVRDLCDNGPAPAKPITLLDGDRLQAHCTWREQLQLVDPGELQRAGLHIGRLVEWSRDRQGIDLQLDRTAVKLLFLARARVQAPVFHSATEAAELRDTSHDADSLA